MNKKGFTLTELVATVAIIAIIGAISITTFNTISKKANAKQKENLLITLKADAISYLKDKKADYVTIDTLIMEGYTTADKTVDGKKVIVDPDPDNKEFPYLNCYMYDGTRDLFFEISHNIETMSCYE